MRRWWRLAGLVVAVVGVTAAPVRAAAPADHYAVVSVAADQPVTEPRAVVAPNGSTVYVVGIEVSAKHTSWVWRSVDSGATWGQRVQTTGGGGDVDLAIDPTNPNRVYVADLWRTATTTASIPISISDDGGLTFAKTVELAPSGSASYDRPWLTVQPNGRVVVIALDRNALEEVAWTSDDGAATFIGPNPVAPATGAGPLTAGPDGTVYFAHVYNGDITTFALPATETYSYSHSADGIHWTTAEVIGNQKYSGWPVIAADAGGTLYLAWTGRDDSTGGQQTLQLATLRPGASTWTRMTLSTTATDMAETPPPAVFPWVTATQAGRVDVTYTEASTPGLNPPLADEATAATTWNLMAARSHNADSPHPTWTHSTVVEAFHTGSMCAAVGDSCYPQGYGYVNAPTPADRRDGDFFGSNDLSNDRLLIPFGHDRPATTGQSNDIVYSHTDLEIARQVETPK